MSHNSLPTKIYKKNSNLKNQKQMIKQSKQSATGGKGFRMQGRTFFLTYP